MMIRSQHSFACRERLFKQGDRFVDAARCLIRKSEVATGFHRIGMQGAQDPFLTCDILFE
jgi:hypothetical protein